jgi:lycopene cyclase domain-containing protein
MFTYLLINLFTIAGPLARSFEPRIRFRKLWGPLFKAIGITGAIFIIWDAVFTHWGVWGFNPRYLIGFPILGLPLEEWMFFITVPYACLFIYEVLNHFIEKDILGKIAPIGALALGILGIGMALNYSDRLYTLSAFGLLGILMALQLLVFKFEWFGRFLLAYLVSLVPFAIVNGLLTGSWLEEMVVWYNPEEMIGWRFMTIPFEDFFYGFDLLFINAVFFERFKRSL